MTSHERKRGWRRLVPVDRFVNVLALMQALREVEQRYFEIARAQRGRDLQPYDAIIYVFPVQVRDRERLKQAFFEAAGSPVNDEGEPIAVPFLNGCFRASAETVSAEHAASMFLGVVRKALFACDMIAEEIRIEVVPSAEGLRNVA